jgi:light-regulated signal transduction histidine kinase (bacteriophytochrome)
MGTIIDGLLRLSRLSRAEPHISDVSLSRIAIDILTSLSENDPQRSVCWTIQAGLYVRGDEGLLHTGLENLLSNAWKFTRDAPAAHIELGMKDIGDEKVYFVRDNGAGFDMAYAEKLFGVFQRLHDVRDFPGTGIGLATVRRIIARHKGRIWADAVPGQGATFYFTLPEG